MLIAINGTELNLFCHNRKPKIFFHAFFHPLEQTSYKNNSDFDFSVLWQRACHPDDKPEWEKGLEDNDFWHIYITEYTVSDHFSTVRRVIGTYDEIAQSYRESVKSIRHFLEDVSFLAKCNDCALIFFLCNLFKFISGN